MYNNPEQAKIASIIISIIILIIIVILIVIVCFNWNSLNANATQPLIQNPQKAVLGEYAYNKNNFAVACGDNEKPIYYYDKNECVTSINGGYCYHAEYGHTGCIPLNSAVCPNNSKTQVFYSNLNCYPNKPNSPCTGGQSSIKCTDKRIYVAEPDCKANQYFFKVYVGKSCSCGICGNCICNAPGGTSFYCSNEGSGCSMN